MHMRSAGLRVGCKYRVSVSILCFDGIWQSDALVPDRDTLRSRVKSQVHSAQENTNTIVPDARRRTRRSRRTGIRVRLGPGSCPSVPRSTGFTGRGLRAGSDNDNNNVRPTRHQVQYSCASSADLLPAPVNINISGCSGSYTCTLRRVGPGRTLHPHLHARARPVRWTATYQGPGPGSDSGTSNVRKSKMRDLERTQEQEQDDPSPSLPTCLPASVLSRRRETRNEKLGTSERARERESSYRLSESSSLSTDPQTPENGKRKTERPEYEYTGGSWIMHGPPIQSEHVRVVTVTWA